MRTPRAIGLVCALFAALTVLMTAPFSLHAGSRVLSLGTDTDLMIWTLGWDVHALVAQPRHVFDANIFYPHHGTLAYSENLLGSVLVAAPVTWLTANPVLAMNAVVLVATLLCGVGGYVLGRALGLTTPASILCGVVFAFSPPRLARLDQVHLGTIQWIPFALAYLHRYVKDGRARDVRIAIAFFSLQALTSGHGAAFLTLGVIVVLVVALANRTPLSLVQRLRDVGLAGVAIALPIVWVYLPYRAAQHDVGLRRPLNDWSSPSWSSFVTSPSHVQSWLISLLPASSVLREPPSAWFFPGVLVIVLAVIALWPRRSARPSPPGAIDARVTYVVMAIVTLALAMGPPYGIWRWLYWLPGLSFVRVPSRFLMLGLLALAVLSAYGFDRWTAAWAPRRRVMGAVALGALMLGEFAFMPLDGIAFRADPPAADQWLATQPKPFAMVDLPIPDSTNFVVRDRAASAFMLHSMAHWQPMLEGYSGIQPPDYGDLYWPITRFPDEASLRLLSQLQIRYAVVHLDLIPPSERAGFDARVARWSSSLTLEHEDASGRVYSIHWPQGK